MLHEWKKCCTSEEFDEQCELYDHAPVDEMSIDAGSIDAQTIYISALDRTLQPSCAFAL